MDKIKVGIVGVGSIAEPHIKAYLENPQAELYALCDINPERLAAVCARYGITRGFARPEEMLALPELDAVSVCTWNSAHAPCAIAALQAGKHVLCEKPMATTAAQAREMAAAAEKAGKLLMIGFVRRFGNDCTILKELIESNFLGDIYYAKAAYLRRNGNPGGWFGDSARSGGGPMVDLGVHVIDLTRYLMGNPRPVSVYGATLQKLLDRPGIKAAKSYKPAYGDHSDAIDVEDLATAMVRYDNGAILQVEASFSLNLKEDEAVIRLFGTKGGARLAPELELYTELCGYLADVQLATPTALAFDDLFENEINHFVDCIVNGTPCRCPAKDGVAVTEIVDAVYQSARSGHEVVLG